MKYVASKLSYQQEFTFYAPAQGGGPAIRTGGITVKGGCNVRDEHTLVLPTDGVITEINPYIIKVNLGEKTLAFTRKDAFEQGWLKIEKL